MKLYFGLLQPTEDFIRQCAADYTENPYAAHAKLLKTSEGKPYLDGVDTFFSVSHSGAYIAAVFSDKPVGIDLEEMRTRNYDSIALRFFTKEEAEAVKGDGINTFYALWTMKEAYYKLSGGIFIPRLYTKDKIEEAGFKLTFPYIVQGYCLAVVSGDIFQP